MKFKKKNNKYKSTIIAKTSMRETIDLFEVDKFKRIEINAKYDEVEKGKMEEKNNV